MKPPITTIGKRKIGPGHPCFIIAELSCNHRGDYDTAVATIKAMKTAGADCVKLQTGKPESFTIDSDKDMFVIKGGTLWDNRTLFSLYEEIYTPWEWHKDLQELAHSLGMEFFSSPFSNDAVDFLEDLAVPAFKIASFEITDIPLITYAAAKGKPMVISTGIAKPEDIELALAACHSVDNHDVTLLKCVSAYPTPLDEVNLHSIQTIATTYQTKVGLSDHSEGYLVPLGSVALGACVIEKHFILNRELGGPDVAFSMTPDEFKEMVDKVRAMETALGLPEINVSDRVEKNRQFSRSLFVVEDIKEGEIITTENVRSIRPGHGMHPKYYQTILGRKAKIAIERGTPLSADLIEEL